MKGELKASIRELAEVGWREALESHEGRIERNTLLRGCSEERKNLMKGELKDSSQVFLKHTIIIGIS